MTDNLKRYRIILASGSPRRQELMKELGIQFETIVKNDVDETYPPTLNPKHVAEYIALQKSRAYAAEVMQGNTLVVTADTVVVCDTRIMGKPFNAKEAVSMLRTLSGKTHRVVSGVALTSADKQVSFSVKTKVTFRTLDDRDIRYYVEHFRPLDKAGAYGIQEWIGLVGIDHIEGSYHNVMGLPTQRLFAELRNF